MKATCEFVKIDSVGRVLIPKGIRKALNIEPNESFQVYTDKGNLVLSRASDVCCICGSKRDLTSIKDKFICGSCKGEIVK